MIFRQSIAKKFESILRSIGELEKLDVLWRDRARVDESLEIDHAVPVFAAIDNDQYFLGQLVGLRERENFEEFVHCAEAARENYQPLRQIREPELTHEEIVELEI